MTGRPRIEAIAARHAEVQQDQRYGAISGEGGESVFAVFGNFSGVAETAHHHFKVIAGVGFVLDDEDGLSLSHAFSMATVSGTR